jgi:nifR3 family TIM-barrel protein
VPTPITQLRNLGPLSSEWLRAAGITTIEQLREVGAAGAYLLVRSQQPKASLNLLWGLAAGLEDRDWRELTEAQKQSLLQEVEERREGRDERREPEERAGEQSFRADTLTPSPSPGGRGEPDTASGYPPTAICHPPATAHWPIDESPLIIGGRVMPSRYFLAPLAGYTHLAFRRVIRELGGLGLATTDLVHAAMLLGKRQKSLELIETDPQDKPLSIQIFGGKVIDLVKAARWLEGQGYQGIDINMGCPMAHINGQGGGAKLMCDPDGACSLVGQVVNAVQIPVTVKMRLGWDASQITAPILAREFEQIGVAAITIHGRTRQQGFHGTVNLEGIRAVVEAVESIPIIGNGDVRTAAEALQMRQTTGCHAVAIGRGALLDPWIFRRIERTIRGENPLFIPTRDEQILFLRRHFQLMFAQHAEYSCLLFRKFAAWYGARLGIPEDLENRLRTFETVEEFESIVVEIAHRHGERESTVPTALIKVPNGPVEHW